MSGWRKCSLRSHLHMFCSQTQSFRQFAILFAAAHRVSDSFLALRDLFLISPMSLPFVGPKYKSGVWICQHISSPQLPAIAQIPLPSRLSSSPRPATCLRNVRTTCPKSPSLVESAPQRRQTYQRVHQWSQQAEAEAVLPQPHQATKRSWEVWDGYSVRIHVAVTLTSTMH